MFVSDSHTPKYSAQHTSETDCYNKHVICTLICYSKEYLEMRAAVTRNTLPSGPVKLLFCPFAFSVPWLFYGKSMTSLFETRRLVGTPTKHASK